MHIYKLENWQHRHNYSVVNEKGEKRTRYVLALTAITMVIEIMAGIVYGSMALLADGWHMATHVAAFLITLFAYYYSRKHQDDPAHTFGTGKVNVLGGFSSAIALAVVALMMCLESLQRIFNPQEIHFNESILVAIIGLVINVASAFLLKDEHHHDHHGHHHDHNLQAAYFHVLADAVTSLLAIIALLAGKFWGWHLLDPIMGIVGAVIITHWAYGLLARTGPILLDASADDDYLELVTEIIEKDSDNRVADCHIWKISPDHYAAIVSLVTHYPKPA
ncbi:MAG: cation transporter, partial [Deltaproteobacteria bacterium]